MKKFSIIISLIYLYSTNLFSLNLTSKAYIQVCSHLISYENDLISQYEKNIFYNKVSNRKTSISDHNDLLTLIDEKKRSHRKSQNVDTYYKYKKYYSHPHVAENGSYVGEISKKTGRKKNTYVPGYYRKNGTYVRGHYRS